MFVGTVRRSLSSLGGLLIIALATMALNPGEAAATCGDYLKLPGAAFVGHEDLPIDIDRSADDRLPHHQCHGPGCSQAPLSAPVNIPLAVVPEKESACLIVLDPLPRDATSSWPLDRSTASPIRLAADIFRPPCTALVC